MSKNKIEFEVGDIVVFQPYEISYPAKVVEVVEDGSTLFGSGLPRYRLSGIEYKDINGRRKNSSVNSECSGVSIQQSIHYYNQYKRHDVDFYYQPQETK